MDDFKDMNMDIDARVISVSVFMFLFKLICQFWHDYLNGQLSGFWQLHGHGTDTDTDVDTDTDMDMNNDILTGRYIKKS